MAHSGKGVTKKKKGGGEIGLACPEPVEGEFGLGIFIQLKNGTRPHLDENQQN